MDPDGQKFKEESIIGSSPTIIQVEEETLTSSSTNPASSSQPGAIPVATTSLSPSSKYYRGLKKKGLTKVPTPTRSENMIAETTSDGIDVNTDTPTDGADTQEDPEIAGLGGYLKPSTDSRTSIFEDMATDGASTDADVLDNASDIDSGQVHLQEEVTARPEMSVVSDAANNDSDRLVEAMLVPPPPELEGEIIMARPDSGWTRCLPDTATRGGKWLCLGLSSLIVVLLGAVIASGAVCGSGLCSSDSNEPQVVLPTTSGTFCRYESYKENFDVTFNGDAATVPASDLERAFFDGYGSIQNSNSCPTNISRTQVVETITGRLLQAQNTNDRTDVTGALQQVRFLASFDSTSSVLIPDSETDSFLKGMNTALLARNVTTITATEIVFVLPPTGAPSISPTATPSSVPTLSSAPSAAPTAWACNLCPGTGSAQLTFEKVEIGPSPYLTCSELEDAYSMLSEDECSQLNNSGTTLTHQTICACPGFEARTGVCFANVLELYRAVNAYMLDGSPDAEVATTYGFPIGSWCVSSITDFTQAFSPRRNPLLSSFNEPLGAWDMSSAVVLDEMFRDNVLFDQDISSWQIDAAKSMDGMFYGSFSNHTRFNCGQADIALWKTSSVTSMRNLFRSSQFNNDGVANWDVGAVVSFAGTFQDTELFNVDISSFDVSSATRLDSMFSASSVFNQPIGVWNTANVQNFDYLFSSSKAFNQDLTQWDLGSATNMGWMFQDAEQFQQNLCSWGSQLQGREVDFGIKVFDNDQCPSSDSPDLSLNPPGPFCFECEDEILPTLEPTGFPTLVPPVPTSGGGIGNWEGGTTPTPVPTSGNGIGAGGGGTNPAPVPAASPSSMPTVGRTGSPAVSPTVSPTVSSTSDPVCDFCKNGATVGAPEKTSTTSQGREITCSDVEESYLALSSDGCNGLAEDGSTEYLQSFCECPGSPPACSLCAGGANVGVPDKENTAGGETQTCAEIQDLFSRANSDQCKEFEDSGATANLQGICECPEYQPEEADCQLCPVGSVGLPSKGMEFDQFRATCTELEEIFSTYTADTCSNLIQDGIMDYTRTACECPGFEPDCPLCPFGSVQAPDMTFGDDDTRCGLWEILFLFTEGDLCDTAEANREYLNTYCECSID